MTISLSRPPIAVAAAAIAIALAAGLGGFELGRFRTAPPASSPPAGRAVLYWYDPMAPAQHFAKPGKSPFMDMQLIPRYGDEAPAESGVRVSPAATQSLGLRLARVERGPFGQSLDVTGVLEFDQRQVAVVQARSAGFVQRVYGRAPGDVVAAGAPIADLLIPAWGGAQAEYLAIRRGGDARLEAAARQRLRLLGMSQALIDRVALSGQPQPVVVMTTPIAGAIQTLDVRQGMTVAAGQTLAQVNGVGTVWLTAQVPEAQAGRIEVGQPATAQLAAYPGETFQGRISALLPAAQSDSRTLQVRVALPSRGGRLKPGMFATVRLGGEARLALFAPSEALIRTGRRTLVMLAGADGRYQPVEVEAGREDRGRTEILAGLAEGQQVVASGQFLLDSEASLAGLQARPLPTPGPVAPRPAPVGDGQ